MKIKAKAPFFDDKGLHKKGDIVEVKSFNPILHEMIVDEEKIVEKKVETATKKVAKKTTRKKG